MGWKASAEGVRSPEALLFFPQPTTAPSYHGRMGSLGGARLSCNGGGTTLKPGNFSTQSTW